MKSIRSIFGEALKLKNFPLVVLLILSTTSLHLADMADDDIKGQVSIWSFFGGEP